MSPHILHEKSEELFLLCSNVPSAKNSAKSACTVNPLTTEISHQHNTCKVVEKEMSSRHKGGSMMHVVAAENLRPKQ